VKSHNRQPRRSRSAAAPTNRSRRSANRGGKSHGPALLFDLDGTLVDSVYEHTLCWHEALQRQRIPVQVWKIHRRIGMTGRLLLHALFRDLGREADPAQIEMLEKLHKENYAARLPNIRVLPGSRELLHRLSDSGIAWAIGSSGSPEQVQHLTKLLEVPSSIPVITGDDVAGPKPNPDAFLAAAERLGVRLADCIIVGDSVWDLLAAGRAKAIGIGFLSGGSGEAELQAAGAYRVYADPADFLNHLEEVGIQTE